MTGASNHSRPSTVRALLVLAVLIVCGGLSAWLMVTDWSISLPLVIGYAMLLFNTYFSIRYFSSRQAARDYRQWISDAALVIIYLLLAFSLDDAMYFVGLTALLFVVATLKYVELFGHAPVHTPLRRKIRVDSLGIVVTTVAALTMLWSTYDRIVTWVMIIFFIIANLDVLWVRPLYRDDAPMA